MSSTYAVASAAAYTQNTKTDTKPVAPPPSATSVQLKEDGYTGAEIRSLKKSGKVECATCASRRYVDGSDDAGVSFKTPTHVSPSQSASAVMSHEREHVTNNAAKAAREDSVASSSVSVFHATCPECGKSYVAGGVTRTQTRKIKENDHFFNKEFETTIGKYIGKHIGKNINEEV
ncbi:MAG: hypothetical protein LBM16_03825 [Clostridiales bacterium]|jgi:DNA-directed RNA polymerase subunit RPC12/RpoP|nr:hypothetical protein [Clostridiales bacterium]